MWFVCTCLILLCICRSFIYNEPLLTYQLRRSSGCNWKRRPTVYSVCRHCYSIGKRTLLTAVDSLLAQHPHFTLHAVGASERSAGKKYKDAVRWKQAFPMSQELGDLVVAKCEPEAFKECDIVFSGTQAVKNRKNSNINRVARSR
jgi:hypothetical protein